MELSCVNNPFSVVVQAEIEKEVEAQRSASPTRTRNTIQSQLSLSPSQGLQTFNTPALDQSRFIGPELPGGRGPTRTAVSLEDLSLEELVARAEQRQLAEQQDQLRSIIDFQRRREAA